MACCRYVLHDLALICYMLLTWHTIYLHNGYHYCIDLTITVTKNRVVDVSFIILYMPIILVRVLLLLLHLYLLLPALSSYSRLATSLMYWWLTSYYASLECIFLLGNILWLLYVIFYAVGSPGCTLCSVVLLPSLC